jgi:lipid-A-disaccharide synthase
MKILICAGDPSAELHAVNLIKTIKRTNPDVTVTSLGGDSLRKISDKFLFDLIGLNVHGLWEPVKQYFRLKKVMTEIVGGYIKTDKPDIFIPVDYYGFNIRLAELCKSSGIPVYYFISPQVWASRKGRLNRIKKTVDHMMVLFPFEKKVYDDAGIPVTFVGHPFLDLIKPGPDKNYAGSRDTQAHIGIFPGSRRQVVRWNLPVMERIAELIKQKYGNVRFTVVGMSNLKGSYDTKLDIAYDVDYETRRQFDLAVTVSGTVTLENALLGIPMIVVYHLPWLMYYLLKSMVLVSQVCIVNLVMGETVVPECIQHDSDPDKVSDLAVSWLQDRSILGQKQVKYKQFREMLGGVTGATSGAINRVAGLIIERTKNNHV